MNTPEKTPSFSIVLAVQDQAEALQGYLSRLLNDQQPTAGGQPVPDFQVIVVDESSTDNTTDLLSSLRADHPRLYSTFVPRYHFQRNPRRLAFTIGMKAAKCEWVIFADVDGFLPSETWLAELAEFAVSPHQLLLGYVKRKTGDVRLKPFDDIAQARGLIMKTELRRLSGGISHLSSIISHLSRRDYDFIAVRADKGHELLRLFESTKQRRL